jgi:hypothetical protein
MCTRYTADCSIDLLKQWELEAREIQLHPKDGLSTILWALRLAAEQAILAFKMGDDPAPMGSHLASDVFVLIIQMQYQKEMFHALGNSFMGIDATHNMMHYENVSLFTVIVRDEWGHGELVQLRQNLHLTLNRYPCRMDDQFKCARRNHYIFSIYAQGC